MGWEATSAVGKHRPRLLELPAVAGSFLVVYYGNSGSSWLIETLSTSKEVLVPGFEPVERWAWEVPEEERLAWIVHALTPPADRCDAALRDWVEGMARNPNFQGVAHWKQEFRVVGFKMTDGSVEDRRRLVEALAPLPTRVLVLGRRNRLKHALSLYRYHEEGKSQFDGRGERPPSVVDLDRFDHWLAESSRLHRLLVDFEKLAVAGLGSERVMPLRYEDFIDGEGKRRLIRQVAGFIGIDPQLVVEGPSFRKATPDDLRRAVVNYDQLVRRYRFSRYRRYLPAGDRGRLRLVSRRQPQAR